MKYKIYVTERRLAWDHNISPTTIQLKLNYNKRNIKYSKFEIVYSPNLKNIHVYLNINRRFCNDFINRRLLSFKPNHLEERINILLNLNKL